MKIKNQKARMTNNKRNHAYCISCNNSSSNNLGNSKY